MPFACSRAHIFRSDKQQLHRSYTGNPKIQNGASEATEIFIFELPEPHSVFMGTSPMPKEGIS